MTARPVSYPCFSSQAVADGLKGRSDIDVIERRAVFGPDRQLTPLESNRGVH